MTDEDYLTKAMEFVVRRLNSVSKISPAAAYALCHSVSVRPVLQDHMDVEVGSSAAFLLRGLACRIRFLDDGRRQLTAFLVPGDLCDHGFLSDCKSTTRVWTLAASVIAEVKMPAFIQLCDDHPDLLRAVLRATSIESAVSDERIVSLGLRSATGRLSHLFCEMHERMEAVGLARNNGYEFHVTQVEIAEGLGMSPVHVNRVLQRLRRANFVTSRLGRIEILDQAGLQKLAHFDPAYLQ